MLRDKRRPTLRPAAHPTGSCHLTTYTTTCLLRLPYTASSATHLPVQSAAAFQSVRSSVRAASRKPPPFYAERKWLCPAGDSSVNLPFALQLVTVTHGPSTQIGIILAKPNPESPSFTSATTPQHIFQSTPPTTHSQQPLPPQPSSSSSSIYWSLWCADPQRERGCQSQYQQPHRHKLPDQDCSRPGLSPSQYHQGGEGRPAQVGFASHVAEKGRLASMRRYLCCCIHMHIAAPHHHPLVTSLHP